MSPQARIRSLALGPVRGHAAALGAASIKQAFREAP
jgi:hypothetical protein